MKRPSQCHPSIKMWAYIVCACFLYALALNLFLAPNNIAAGGLGGIATVLNRVFQIRISVLILIMNVPLVALALVIKGWRFIGNTIVGFITYTLFVELTSAFPTASHEPLVAAVFGGALYGAGMALMSVANGSIGGTELIIRMLLNYFPTVGIGKMCLMVDGAVVILSMVVFHDVEIGLYAIITLYVCSYFADKLLLGFERGTLCFIITGKSPESIAQPLMQKLDLSITKLSGVGMFTGQARSILLTAIHAGDTSKLKAELVRLDPEGFVVIAPVNEVLGGRFCIRSAP